MTEKPETSETIAYLLPSLIQSFYTSCFENKITK